MTSNDAWKRLLDDYEAGRAKPDSLDRLLEWDAQCQLIGDLRGRSVLDVGCGNGSKAVEMAVSGASSVIGIDVAGQFVTPPDGLDVHLHQGDLSELDSHPALIGRRFDVITVLMALGYARDVNATLKAIRGLLQPGGCLVIARAHPIRFAVERAEQQGIPLGEAYHQSTPVTYRAGWNDEVTLTHRAETFATMINDLVGAGFYVDEILEPQLSQEARERYPHKQAWLSRYVGVILLRARLLDECRAPAR
ncbi:class I SAM-dependent methyltransferase [Microlunatus parietis]|uniref:2-polyprenyl-3-methyl-5-hydroxy-6-metoxy-1, 4-benzoquinol methylase n=1 Tax=Microlunatus parietis TaxID=682979 RepID=A0A7Y9LAT5_9ACTN|nr:class I SAM-dependent methyltransferase [Microlunatus parietis]NYE69076.1 2-polyprenyl-3-methyl-5-hydroxy-6-metoxy-1,4-benzoquinol methylase [Microlunatus parietis]